MQRLEAEQAQLSEEVERLREETDRLRSALDDELEKLREQLSALTATMQTTLEGLKERGEERARELGEKTTEVAGDQLRELLRTATEALRRINESLGETEKARE
jgi:ElaB/YqjD/DUF883 family membrane-anchored ribosome-binding protein